MCHYTMWIFSTTSQQHFVKQENFKCSLNIIDNAGKKKDCQHFPNALAKNLTLLQNVLNYDMSNMYRMIRIVSSTAAI